MSPQELFKIIAGHDWMPLLLMLSFVVRTWLTDKSKFPLSLPVNWQPVVVAAATAFLNVVASLQAHLPWESILMSTLAWAATTGFLDGVLAAIWGDPKKAPVWGRFLVMAFDDLEAGKGGGGTGSVTVVVPPGGQVFMRGGGGGGGSGPPIPLAAESEPTVVTKVPSVPPKAPAAERLWRPIGVVIFGLVTVGQLLLFSAYMGCGGATAGLPTTTDLAQYWADQNGCVDKADTRGEADACRSASRTKWCAKFPKAGNCAPDAGADE